MAQQIGLAPAVSLPPAAEHDHTMTDVAKVKELLRSVLVAEFVRVCVGDRAYVAKAAHKTAHKQAIRR